MNKNSSRPNIIRYIYIYNLILVYLQTPFSCLFNPNLLFSIQCRNKPHQYKISNLSKIDLRVYVIR
jgi:hypothetical protein